VSESFLLVRITIECLLLSSDFMGQTSKRLIIKAGNIFDSLSGKILKNHTIVISGKVISWIGKDSSYEKERNDKIIDASEKFVMPGMVESHVHLDTTGNPQTEREYLRTKTAMWPFYGLLHSQQHLMSGFTCVRDCGAEPDWSPSLKRMFNLGLLAGPRLIVSDRFLAQAGTQEAVMPDFRKREYTEIYSAKAGIDGVIQAVRDRKFHGSDFIKTATTGGVLHGIESKLAMSFWSDEELDAMVKEAHRTDMHVACHAHGREGVYRAVKAGIDTIEHGSFMDEETAELMVKKGTYLIPTQAALMNLTSENILKQMPPEVQRKTLNTAKNALENHRMAFKKGVKIAIGTDAGTPGNFHGHTGSEVKYMVENVGMTPVQALQAATIEGARACSIEEKIGSLEVGKLADIVISKKNPLEEISVLEKPINFTHVIKDGMVMVEKGKITYFVTK